jgi:hypothetical protein
LLSDGFQQGNQMLDIRKNIIDATGINITLLTSRELFLLCSLIPPGSVVPEEKLVPYVSFSMHGLQQLTTRLRHQIEPQGWTILSRKGVGYALLKMANQFP